MKRALIGLLATYCWAATCPTGYNYAVPITIHGAQVGSGTQTNFTHMVCLNGASAPCNNSGLVLADIKTVANGGKVQHTATATVPFSHVIPADLVFTDGTSAIPFEVQGYSATTGELHAWVKQSVTGGTDSVIYACYGNTAVTTDQSTPSSTWDTPWSGVWHLSDGSVLNLGDSTGKNSTIVNYSATATSSPLGGAAAFASGAYMRVPAFSSPSPNFTIEVWVMDVTPNPLAPVVASMQPGEFVDDAFQLGIDMPKPRFLIFSGDQPRSTDAASTATVGVWHHLVGRTDGSALVVFVDGVKTSAAAVLNINAITRNLQISGIESAAGYGLTGSVADLRVSSNALSDEWIATEYANQSDPATYYAVGSVITVGTPPPPTGKGQVIIF